MSDWYLIKNKNINLDHVLYFTMVKDNGIFFALPSGNMMLEYDDIDACEEDYGELVVWVHAKKGYEYDTQEDND